MLLGYAICLAMSPNGQRIAGIIIIKAHRQTEANGRIVIGKLVSYAAGRGILIQKPCEYRLDGDAILMSDTRDLAFVALNSSFL